nr:hypothetical protein [uncultured Eisenbergiella sp.]
MEDRIRNIDVLTEIRKALEDLCATMAVIYEGLYKGGMTEESPHCILLLQSATEAIIRRITEEEEKIKREGDEN